MLGSQYRRSQARLRLQAALRGFSGPAVHSSGMLQAKMGEVVKDSDSNARRVVEVGTHEIKESDVIGLYARVIDGGGHRRAGCTFVYRACAGGGEGCEAD